LSDTAASREQLRDVLPYIKASPAEAEEYVVRHLLSHQSIRSRDVADVLDVTEVHRSRILRDLRESAVVAFRSEQTRGRGVFHVRGPREEEALRRHGITPHPQTNSRELGTRSS